MPPSPLIRRTALLFTFLTIGLLVMGTAAHPAQPVSEVEERERAGQSESTAQESPTPIENTSLLSRDELYETYVDTDRNSSNASLYFVAENGSWYHAYPNGTIGALAPDGAVIPNIEDQTANLPPSDRPVYVWKVTLNECGTTFYNATDGTTIASYPIPGCDAPSPSPETSTASPIPDQTDTPATGTTPGFGIGIAVGAILVAIGLRVWH